MLVRPITQLLYVWKVFSNCASLTVYSAIAGSERSFNFTRCLRDFLVSTIGGSCFPKNPPKYDLLMIPFILQFQYCNGGDLADYLNGKFKDF